MPPLTGRVSRPLTIGHRKEVSSELHCPFSKSVFEAIDLTRCDISIHTHIRLIFIYSIAHLTFCFRPLGTRVLRSGFFEVMPARMVLNDRDESIVIGDSVKSRIISFI